MRTSTLAILLAATCTSYVLASSNLKPSSQTPHLQPLGRASSCTDPSDQLCDDICVAADLVCCASANGGDAYTCDAGQTCSDDPSTDDHCVDDGGAGTSSVSSDGDAATSTSRASLTPSGATASASTARASTTTAAAATSAVHSSTQAAASTHGNAGARATDVMYGAVVVAIAAAAAL